MKQKNPSIKKRTGRPTDYTLEFAKNFCETLATSTLTVAQICASDGMPNKATIYDWLNRHSEFDDLYMRARARQADVYIQQIIDIADDSSCDNLPGKDGPISNSVAVARARLKIDTRKWIACKLIPKIYGDKIEPPIEPNKTSPLLAEIMNRVNAIVSTYERDN